jgi:hypothetical protein
MPQVAATCFRLDQNENSGQLGWPERPTVLQTGTALRAGWRCRVGPWLLRATALCIRDDEVTSARRLPASGMIAAYCGSYGIACRASRASATG